jgi:hypothetical protein
MTVNSRYSMKRLDTAGTFDAIYQVANAKRNGSRILIHSGNSEEVPL